MQMTEVSPNKFVHIPVKDVLRIVVNPTDLSVYVEGKGFSLVLTKTEWKKYLTENPFFGGIFKR